jgi:hypothetical protein
MTTTYVTYQYYTDTYLGSVIASTLFAQLALRASAQIDVLTFNRTAAIIAAATDAATIDKIKMATCAVAEELQTQAANGNADGIQSESTGNNSVSYATNSVKMKSSVQKLADQASLYLSSTGLMFRGFASGEYGGDIDVS